MSKRKGVLTVISGYSGSGKGTVMKALMAKYGEVYKLSVSATTRKPREGEEHGREYFFVNREEFERMIAEEELLEHACYVENYYGTPKAAVVECLEKGRNPDQGKISGGCTVVYYAAECSGAEASLDWPRNRDSRSDRSAFKARKGRGPLDG